MVVPAGVMAASGEQLLRVRAAATSAPVAPVVLRLRVPRDATLGVRVNGHAVASPEIAAKSATARIVHLNVRDGLRPGTNRIRLSAVRPTGQRDVDVRSVRLRPTQVLADAGADRAVSVGRRVRLGAPAAHAGSAYRWRLVGAPAKAKVTVGGKGTARPWLRASRPGHYTMRVSARRGGRTQDTDLVSVAVRPDDPPLGARLETMASPTGTSISIAGQPVRDTTDHNGIFVAVLDLDTRQNVESGTVPSSTDGADQLYRIAQTRSATSRYMVIVSASHAVSSGTALALKRVFDQIGTPWDQNALMNAYQGFSVVGNAAGIAGSGTVRVPRDGSPNLTGYLRVDAATNRYLFVADGHTTFDTSVPAARTDRHNAMAWAGRTYEATLPAGTTAGFQVLTVDDFTDAVTNEVLATNGAGAAEDAKLQSVAGARLQRLAQDRQPGLVLLQSIGAPYGSSAGWNRVAAGIRALGGNELVAYDLDGKTGADGPTGYALAGRASSEQGAAEGSPLLGTVGRVAGTTTRNLRSQREAIMADPYATTNTDLVELTDQAAQRFPDWSSPGEAAAARQLGVAMDVCPDDTSACDVRASYWRDYAYNWTRRSTSLRLADYPEGARYTEAEWGAAKRELSAEIRALTDVKTYFDELQKPFTGGGAQDGVDLKAISGTLLDALPGDARSRITSSIKIRAAGYTVLLAGKGLAQLIKKGGDVAAGKVLSSAAGTVGALFSLLAFLSPDGDRPVLGGELVARAGELGASIGARYETARSMLVANALVLVSDYGKLMAASRHINTDWALPATNGKIVAALRTGSRQSFGRALVPAAFPILRRGWGRVGPPPTPANADVSLPDYRIEPDNVRDFKCWTGVVDKDAQTGKRVPRLRAPFAAVPDSGQIHPIVQFDGNPQPVRSVFFFVPDDDHVPTAAITDWIFGADPQVKDGLALNPFDVFDPRNYQDIRELKPYDACY